MSLGSRSVLILLALQAACGSPQSRSRSVSARAESGGWDSGTSLNTAATIPPESSPQGLPSATPTQSAPRRDYPPEPGTVTSKRSSPLDNAVRVSADGWRLTSTRGLNRVAASVGRDSGLGGGTTNSSERGFGGSKTRSSIGLGGSGFGGIPSTRL